MCDQSDTREWESKRKWSRLVFWPDKIMKERQEKTANILWLIYFLKSVYSFTVEWEANNPSRQIMSVNRKRMEQNSPWTYLLKMWLPWMLSNSLKLIFWFFSGFTPCSLSGINLFKTVISGTKIEADLEQLFGPCVRISKHRLYSHVPGLREFFYYS